MVQYFRASKLEDEEAKVQTAVIYLTDDAMLWWRRRHSEIERGLCTINTWEELKAQLKAQFRPSNVEYLARKSLMKLKHTGSIREYVKQFTTILLDITSMTEEDKLFHFMNGLQPWAEQELQRLGVQDFASAVAAAERLVEFTSRAEGNPRPKPSPSTQKGKGGRDVI